MATYDVMISQTALGQLSDCVMLVAQANLEAAQRIRHRLVTAVRSLGELPERYPFLNEAYLPQNKYHKMFVEKWYLVLYQIRDTTVYVEYVVDCRQDYRWLVR